MTGAAGASGAAPRAVALPAGALLATGIPAAAARRQNRWAFAVAQSAHAGAHSYELIAACLYRLDTHTDLVCLM